jgi:hypothetical protein
MRSMRRLVVVASFLALAGLGLSAVLAADSKQSAGQGQVVQQKQSDHQKQGPTQDRWRYTFHNGEWWYWLPTDRWVYWRNDRWNDYDPKAYTAPVSPGGSVASRTGSTDGSRAVNDSDIRPFYGHAVSNLDRRTLEENNEVGPFYGHALPSEVFGPGRGRRGIRPFYGHAVSSSGE